METYQAIAWPVDIIVYRRGKEVERIERGPNQSYERMEAVLKQYGYEITSKWDVRKVGEDMMAFVTLRK